VKDSVNTVWWLSKQDYPKADVRRVLVPYSARMRKLLEDAERFYTPKKRPSGHDISGRFAEANDGAIPSNLLEISNTESTSRYLRLCKLANIEGHPARFPEKLPAFFIAFLTDPGDLVLDFFAGSNTTGAAAEAAGRRWIAFESSTDYLAASVFRFTRDLADADVLDIYERLSNEPEAALRILELQSRLEF
jgi:site-specific DNA-methyltransferase (cytosine-N4-specific)